MASKSRLRVGAVSYLNTRPLIEGITADDPLIDLKLDVPSGLADGLIAGVYDIALIPMIEYFRGGDYVILPGMAIASHGPVKSVCLFSRVPIGDIQSVGLDTSSRTSHALVQILLAEQYGMMPRYTQSSPNTDPRNAPVDATLLIGDPALKAERTELHVLDLGEAWGKFTGLPFVYACWVARAKLDKEQLLAAFHRLNQAKTEGQKHVEAISVRAAVDTGLAKEVCLRYLTQHVHHDLGESEIAGAQLFYRYAMKHQLVPENRTMRFVEG